MQFDFPKTDESIIKVIGVGGGGGNAVNNMFAKGIEGVDFIICNTDKQALNKSDVPTSIQLGGDQTEGLGAGADPEVGKTAAEASLAQLKTALENGTKMAFITAGMGGGTGTGGAPVIARLAKELGILTVGIVTTPFKFEGPSRTKQAQEGLLELEKNVDTLIVIDNNNLHEILGKGINMRKAFEEADQVLCDAAKGIAEIITNEGYINVDFADVCTVMRDGGKSLMGTATASGEGRALEAVEAAINSPLLDKVSLLGSRAIVLNITASEESLAMEETTDIVDYIQNAAGEKADIIYGIVFDDEMGNDLRVTVVATRFEDSAMPAAETRIEEEAPEEIPGPPAQTPAQTIQEENRQVASRIDKRERNNRIQKLNSRDYDVHDPDSLQELENVPAFQRKHVTLDEGTDEPQMSHTSLEEDEKEKFKFTENTFLHDNVD